MIFIIGCPRSGTTLLRDLLRSHPRLSFLPETYFIPSFYRAYGDPTSEEAARRLARAILRFPWVQRCNLDLAPADFAECRSYREVVETVFREFAAREGKSRWGDKTPAYVRDIPVLANIFPGARFVHVIRDGRDVALSFARAPFGPANVYRAASTWKVLVSTGRRSGSRLGSDAYLEVRYETLVTEPEDTLRRICDFIGEPFDPLVLHPDRLGREGKGRTPPPVSRQSIVATHVTRWKRSMSPTDIVLFESVAGDLLGELGYEVGQGTRPSPAPSRLWWEVQDRIQRSLNVLRSRNHLTNYLLLRRARIRAALRRRGLVR